MSDNDALLLDDVRSRSEALDVSRSLIVQAPAGSGKTELLIQRYLKLLPVVDNPEEILAITFTRKAAAEMQLRVLEALRRHQCGDVPEEEHLRLTFDLAGDALRQSAERNWNLIENPKRLRILTLDALNAFVSRAQPLSAPECASGARIIVDAELKVLHNSAAVATLDWLTDDGDMQTVTREVLQHVDNNTALYVSYIAQMLATRDQWLPFVGSGLLSEQDALALRARFEESLRFAVSEHLARTAALFIASGSSEFDGLPDYAAQNLIADGAVEHPICALAGSSAIPSAEVETVPLWTALAELLLTKDGAFRKKVDKRQGFPTSNKEKKAALTAQLAAMSENPELAELLHAVRTLPPLHYRDEQWNVLLSVFRLLPLAVGELKRLFAEQATADHTEIALNAGAALGTAQSPGDVALLLDYQVRHLLVDEMQDTSSAQYAMLEALTGGWEAGDGRTLYCVGDPMQSIYRFRNAEVGQFLLAREFGIGHIKLEPLLLRRNFRSGEHLVSWFNHAFPSILADHNNPQHGAVAYSEAVSAPHLSDQGRCEVHPVFGTDPAEEAELGCEVIAQTLDTHPDDDVVVLVRGRTQLPHLLASLRKAGIAYRAVDIDRLTDLAEVIDVLALTRAAVHQGDRIAWLGLLRAPWLGMSWSDLQRLVMNDRKSTVWELLQDDTRIAQLSPQSQAAVASSLPILRALVEPRRARSLREVVEQCWLALGGPATLDDADGVENVYRYFDVLGRMERAGTLWDVATLEATLDLERVSSDETARLQVMTMHRAKGLQFDHVVLYGLGRAPGSGERRVLSWFDFPGQRGIEHTIISPIGPRAEVEKDPVHRYIELTAAEKDKHEQSRLLYVACTRARKSLHLIGNVSVAVDGESYKPPRSNSLLYLLWPFVNDHYAAAFESYRAPLPGADESLWLQPQLRRFVSPWRLPEVEPLPGADVVDEAVAVDAEVEFYWVGTEARIAGTLVHRWLQLLAENQANPSRMSPDQMPAVTLRWLREMGIGAQQGAAVVTRVQTAVERVLADARGRWVLAGDGYSELALSGVYADELVAVILDRVRIDDDGTHWIIDYKTSTHEGGNLDGFLQVETDRYRPQLARYAAIYNTWAGTDAKCALYFPLLQSFVEVTV